MARGPLTTTAFRRRSAATRTLGFKLAAGQSDGLAALPLGEHVDDGFFLQDGLDEGCDLFSPGVLEIDRAHADAVALPRGVHRLDELCRAIELVGGAGHEHGVAGRFTGDSRGLLAGAECAGEGRSDGIGNGLGRALLEAEDTDIDGRGLRGLIEDRDQVVREWHE